MARNFVFIGHSHINALILAARNHHEFSERMHFFHLKRDIGDEPLLFDSGKEKKTLNSKIKNALVSLSALDRTVIISLIGGNAHNVLGMLKHPIPFDFLNDESDEIIQDDGTVFISYAQMHDVMLHRVKYRFEILDIIKSCVSLPMFHLESPPPVGNCDYILKHLGPHFNQIPGDKEVAPRSLRKKLWQLHSRVFEDHCNATDVGFIPVPPGTLDEEGFLKIEGYSSSATHGNVWYGEQVLNDVVQRFAACE